MRLRDAFGGAVIATLLSACASAPPAAVTPAPEAPLVAGGGSVRPKVEKATLDNGLDVYFLPDAGAPLVCVQVWAKVGSVDEHEGPNGTGITGLSHFFEHLMFQGTERFPNYDLALAPLGARNNAFTYQDATVFWAYTPKEHLRHILDIEADRFAKIKVDFVHLEPEREVVKSERRQNTDADAGELAEERVVQRTFDVFPYRWGPIGWMTDLDAIPLATAQQYHLEHYTTRGAFLVIAGDFDPTTTLAWVKETWGALPGPVQQRNPSELVLKGESWVGPRHDHIVRSVANPIVYWSYRAPAPSGATLRDYAALELVDHALTAGKAGRLSQKLVFTDDPKVSSLSAWLTPLRFPYAYIWRADLLDGATTGEVETALDLELMAIREHGLSDAELAQAVASLRTDAVRTNLSNSDKAETIGMSIASTGEPFALYERLEAYPTITQAEIKAAVAKWLVPEHRARVVVVSPDRLIDLVLALRDSDPNARPLAPALEAAVKLFVHALELRDQRAEVDREARAISLLNERAEVAQKAAAPDEKAAILAYVEKNEMGVVERTKRNRAQNAALVLEEGKLVAAQREVLAATTKLEKTSRADLAGRSQGIAIRLLATPLSESIAVPAVQVAGVYVPLAAGLAGSEQRAVQAIAAFALEARGLAKSAQDARGFVIANAELDPTLEPDVKELAQLSIALALDTDVRNVPLADVATTAPTRRAKTGGGR